MPTTRREFLQSSAVAASALAFSGSAFATLRADDAAGAKTDSKKDAPIETSANPRKILILGGTGFLGPAIVEAATRRGHTLTLFNRGKTNPQLFPDIEKLRGDRKTKDLASLVGRKWDVVVDDCGYIPRHVREMCDVLKGHVDQYIFISSVSAFGEKIKPNTDETAPLGTMGDETFEEVNEHTYGPLKALCEKAAETAFPGHTTNIRPGLIVGPTDPTDRFTYWPVRIDRGGEVLCPGDPTDPIQLIDVRDLGEWIVHVIEQRTMGIFSALGPEKTLTIGRLIEACVATTTSKPQLTWADADFLESQQVSAWGDMPVWVPPRGDEAGFGQFNNKKAIGAGLKFRPIADTVRDTLAWWQAQPEERRAKLKAGISPEREAKVLKAWSERTSSKRK